MSKIWTKQISRALDATVSIEDNQGDGYGILYIRLEAECRDIRVCLHLSGVEVEKLVAFITEAKKGEIKFKSE